MTSKKFNKEFEEICLQYGFTPKPEHEGQVRFVGETPFGKMQIISSPSPRIKLYTLYFRFLEDFDIEFFYKYFSKHETINRNSKKWNLHNPEFEFVLNELDERLNNLVYILKRDGKVCETNPKPFLEEIEE